MKVAYFYKLLLDLSVLIDLKHLLLEAGQQLPQFLQQLAGPDDEKTHDVQKQLNTEMDKGCSYCSGLGHRITNCPKLESIRTKVNFILPVFYKNIYPIFFKLNVIKCFKNFGFKHY